MKEETPKSIESNLINYTTPDGQVKDDFPRNIRYNRGVQNNFYTMDNHSYKYLSYYFSVLCKNSFESNTADVNSSNNIK